MHKILLKTQKIFILLKTPKDPKMHRNDPLNIVQYCDDPPPTPPPPPKKKKKKKKKKKNMIKILLNTQKIFILLKTPKDIKIKILNPKK